MRLTEWRIPRSDGGTDIITQGPVSPAWRAGRVVWALIFILTAIIVATQGAWSMSGFALFVGALILPSFKHRKASKP